MLTRRQVENLKRLTRDGFGWASQHEHEAIATLEAAVAAARHFSTCSHDVDIVCGLMSGDCADCSRHREFLRQFEGND